MDYKQKYLKYKNKYLHLKGGISPDQHIKYALDEFQKAIITITSELNCCFNDIEKTYNEFKALQTFGKPLNVDIYELIKFTPTAKVPINKTDETLIRKSIHSFVESLYVNFQTSIKYINEKIKLDEISNITNDTTFDHIYDFFVSNYGTTNEILFHTCYLLAQALQLDIEKKNLPYIKFDITERNTGCDASIKYDCLLLIFAQKLPRLMMPFNEIISVLRKHNYQYIQKFEIIAKNMKEHVDKINKLVKYIDDHNMSVYHTQYIRVNTAQFNEIYNTLKCKECNSKSNRKTCCIAPCQYNFITTTCKYVKK